jgi:hypothetical protein
MHLKRTGRIIKSIGCGCFALRRRLARVVIGRPQPQGTEGPSTILLLHERTERHPPRDGRDQATVLAISSVVPVLP